MSLTTTTRPNRRQVNMLLPNEVADALAARARREREPSATVARRLLVDALIASGDLHAEPQA